MAQMFLIWWDRKSPLPVYHVSIDSYLPLHQKLFIHSICYFSRASRFLCEMAATFPAAATIHFFKMSLDNNEVWHCYSWSNYQKHPLAIVCYLSSIEKRPNRSSCFDGLALFLLASS